MLLASTTKPCRPDIRNILRVSERRPANSEESQGAAADHGRARCFEAPCVILRLRNLHNMQISSTMADVRHGDDWSMASTELQETAVPAVGFSMSKYQLWYEGLMDKARCRNIPATYTEVHHVIPRSFGGSDCPFNLVRLTYREHFVAHWLLTKFHDGLNLQKMQFAIYAMSLRPNGQRIVSSWQFDVVKRALADMRAETSRRNQVFPSGLPEARKLFLEQNSIGEARKRRELDRLAEEFLSKHPKVMKSPSTRPGRRALSNR